MIIRKARPDEAETLTRLALRSKRSWGYDDRFMAAIREDMVVPREFLERDYALVAEQDGAIAAYAILHLDAARAYLRDLFVDAPYMGAGVGAALFDAMLAHARAVGATKLTLVADPNAVGFYERCGMREIGREVSTYVPGRTLPVMGMDL